MSLRLRRLKLLVVTEAARYGTDITFPDGLVSYEPRINRKVYLPQSSGLRARP